MRNINIIEYLKSKLFGKEEVKLGKNEIEGFFHHYESSKFYLTEIALFTAIDLISRTVAKCEFVTSQAHEESHGAEYFAWNYRPNKNQTKDEFISEFVRKLLFKGEALIIESADGQRLVAESFSKKEYALFDDTFSSVTVKGYTFNKVFKASEVIYLKRNNIGVVNILSSMCRSFEKLMGSAEKRYNKSIGHKGFLNIESFAQNDQNFEKRFEDLMNRRFKEYFNAQDAVLTLYDGFHYTEPTSDASKTTQNEINDIQKLKSEIVETVGNALHIPLALIRGDASQLKDAIDSFIGNAIEPITRPLAQAVTAACYGYDGFKRGNYCIIDTTSAKHIDAISSAVNIEKAISSRVITPAKAQSYCNMLPSNDESATTYYVTKNLQTAAQAVAGEGGEK